MLAEEEVPWSISQVKEYFKKYSESYDDSIDINSYPAPYILSEWVKQECISRSEVQMLDLGCGTGISSKFFFDDERFQIVGVDLTLEMLKKAKLLPFKSLHCLNIANTLDFVAASFDAVICVGVLDFIVEKVNIISNMSKVLKNGGIAAFTIPAKISYEDQLINLLKDYQFSILKSKTFFGYQDSTSGNTVKFRGFLLKKYI